MTSPTTSRISLADALACASDTRSLEIGTGLLAMVPRIFRARFGDRHAVVVADRNTWSAAGARVASALAAAAHPSLDPFVFGASDVCAESRFVEELERFLQAHAAIPIAVGSGTINDLTKLAAHRAQRPFMCVATAASMDGYTAYGASITHQGSKQTFQCPAPAAVVADLATICSAPGAMNAWGYADLIAKVTAGADWMVADALGVEPIDGQAWQIVQGGLRDLIADPAGVQARDPAATCRLVEGLMLGGLAMQSARSSRPASGAEHQFSHLWDMQHHTHQGAAPSHGFKVGVATLAVTALYGYLLEQPIGTLDVECCCQAWPDPAAQELAVRRLFAEGGLADKAVEETAAKYCSRETLRTQLLALRSGWPALQARLRRQLLPLDRLRAMLRAAGAPTEPQEIGISRERLRASFRMAYHIRRRFTVLDLAVRIGMLEPALDSLFGVQGPWPISDASTGAPHTR
jgi:glycerol-1-phosphate dehydrogenase [NAD(P)+]